MNIYGIGAMISLICLGGCISVSYEGKTFQPTDKVEVYMEKKDVPENLTVIGKAVAYAPSENYSFSEIKKKLIEKAKAKGADAILIREVDEKNTGSVRSDESALNDDTSWGMSGDSEGDIKSEDYYFQDQAEGTPGMSKTFSVKVKTLFLKKK